MQIFDLLKSNKGTVSSALGKDLANKVLNGDLSILQEAIKYVVFDLPYLDCAACKNKQSR